MIRSQDKDWHARMALAANGLQAWEEADASELRSIGECNAFS